jgi:hypothetical protein
LLRRNFSGGTALVNPPGSPAQTVQLPAPMHTAGGAIVTSVTLAPASGVVLLGALPEAPTDQAPAEAATQTTLETRVVRARGNAGRRGSAALAARFTRARHGRTLSTRVAGLVRHATHGTVVVAVERFGRRHWRLTRRLPLRLSSAGRFVHLMSLPAGANYRVSATYTGASGYRPSWSGFRVVSLRAR